MRFTLRVAASVAGQICLGQIRSAGWRLQAVVGR